jgi:hypothetical protein
MTGAQHAQGSLQDRAVLQLAMRLELLQIEPVEQRKHPVRTAAMLDL